MADQRLPQKDQKVTPQDDFKIHVVDPNDLSVHPTGKSFWMSRLDFLGNIFAGLFTSLTDTPSSYTGQGFKTVKVNSDEDALIFEFAEFLKLNDVDETTFTTKSGQVVKVNATANGLEFSVNSFINLSDVSETTLENNQGKAVVVDVDTSTEPATYSLKFKNFPSYEDLYGGNAIIRGGLVYRGTLLNYTIWADRYLINGTYYDIPVSGDVTNSVGDATHDRFDVYFIEIDDSDPPNINVGILEGTPSANPIIPTLDLLTQVQVSVALISATETTPADVVTEEIFNDNTGGPDEWTNVLLPAGADLADLVDPKVGVSSVSFPAYATPSVISWQNDVQWTYVREEFLVFYIKNTNTFTPQATLEVQLINSVTSDYWLLTLTPQSLTNYGFNPSISDWQLIQVNLSDFVASSRYATEYNTLQITLNRTPAMNLDWIVLQGGVTNPSGSIDGFVLTTGSTMERDAVLNWESNGFSGAGTRIKITDPNDAHISIGSIKVLPSLPSVLTIGANIFTEDGIAKKFNDALEGASISIGNTIDFKTSETSTSTIETALTIGQDETISENVITAKEGIRADVGSDRSAQKVFTTDGGIAELPNKTYTFATLPTPTSGLRAFVNDSSLSNNGTNQGSIVLGGGANFVPVYADGTNWRIG